MHDGAPTPIWRTGEGGPAPQGQRQRPARPAAAPRSSLLASSPSQQPSSRRKDPQDTPDTATTIRSCSCPYAVVGAFPSMVVVLKKKKYYSPTSMCGHQWYCMYPCVVMACSNNDKAAAAWRAAGQRTPVLDFVEISSMGPASGAAAPHLPHSNRCVDRCGCAAARKNGTNHEAG